MPKGDTIERHNYATRKLYDKNKFPSLWDFRAVDGEGGNVAEPGTLFGTRHQYLSLRCGPDLLETGNPLSWRECFTFLANQKPRGFIYVAYFFDYDVTMMIRTLPKHIVQRLLDRHKRDTEGEATKSSHIRHVSYEGFDFDYLPHKEFKIRWTGAKHWVTINDVGSFFQAPFLTTLEKWDVGTPEERACIAKGKSMRADFAETTEEIKYYNTLECVLLEILMTRFRQTCEEVGYVPKKWQGPGQLAAAMLAAHGIPKRDEIPILQNPSFYLLALATYYGGRFETTATGPIAATIYQYDINGAYVSMLRNLPCLLHGSWREVFERPISGLWFGTVEFKHTGERRLNNLPFRRQDGTTCYPRYGVGTYWSVEIEAAERAGTDCQFRAGWVYENHCDCNWFSWVDSYYAQRLRLGKSAKGLVLKLAGNSIYGKIAQSIGYAPYANPVWAGLITAGCRALLISAYSQSPNTCYMLATDGLFMGEPLDLPLSNKLGEWEQTVHPDGIFIVQPGLYYLGAKAKSRGVERGRINNMREEFEKNFALFVVTKGLHYTVKVPVDNFVTARIALFRNKWNTAGTWERTFKEIAFYSHTKRAPQIVNLVTNPDGSVYHRTMPYHGEPNSMSMTYGRLIGGGLRIAEENRWTSEGARDAAIEPEQPDWVAPLWEAPA